MVNPDKRPKVVHLTSAHQPLDTRIFVKECRTLAAVGYEVVLVCPGSATEERDGVRLQPVETGRSRVGRMTRTTWRVLRQALREQAQVYHFHDPELIPVGGILRLLGHRVVYDVHEDLPLQVQNKEWIPGPVRPLVAWLAGVLGVISGRVFTHIVAATPPIAARFPAAKTVVVQNFPLLSEFAAPTSTPYVDRPPNVAYVGSISHVRGATHAVRAIAALPDDLAARLVLAGKLDSPEYLRELQSTPGWGKVDFVGWLERDGVRRVLSGARLGLLTLHPVSNYLESYPVKLFEYMLAGLPVVASRFPLWERIIADADCGIMVDPLEPREIAAAIEYLLRNPAVAQAMGERGRAAVLAKYRWDHEAGKLVATYRRWVPVTLQDPGTARRPPTPMFAPTQTLHLGDVRATEALAGATLPPPECG